MSSIARLRNRLRRPASASDDGSFSGERAPHWSALPAAAQADLARRGYQTEVFAGSHTLRQTALNLYVKMQGLGLWRFVARESGGTSPGCLEFVATDVQALKRALRDRPDFTSPAESSDVWSSRELRAVGQLHLKHDSRWCHHGSESIVQGHIDPHGLLLRSRWWWLCPPIPLGQMAAHGLTRERYSQPFTIRDVLLAEGADPRVLWTAAVPRLVRSRSRRWWPWQSRT